MKKILFSGIMSVLLLVGSISMVSMAPPPPLNTICQGLFQEFAANGGPEFFGINKGQFISLCNVCLNKATGPANQAVCICKDLAIEDPNPDSNFGQCVNSLK